MADTFEIDYEKFKKDLKSILGIDLNQYKPAQMMRRIKSFIQKYSIVTLGQFTEVLKRDAVLLATFKDYLTINVTEFYRNADKFEDLRIKLLPSLIQNMKAQGRASLKIWSAGCSIGAEAYTLSIIMNEYFKHVPYSILATDIDTTILKNARMGEYRELEIKNISKPLLDKYFDFQKDTMKWRLKPVIMDKVTFSLNNLLEDKFSKGFDLILCRNVVIYFTEEAKDMLYRKFYESLIDGGCLFIGGTESILNSKQIGFKNNTGLFYYK